MSGAEVALLLPALEGAGAAAGAGTLAELAPLALPEIGALSSASVLTPQLAGFAAPSMLPSSAGLLTPELAGFTAPNVGGLSSSAVSPFGPSGLDKFMSGVGKAGNALGKANAMSGLLGGGQQPQAAPMPAPQPGKQESLMSILEGRGFTGTNAPNAQLKFGVEARKMGMTPQQLAMMLKGRM